jgi:hypothetical protein
MTSFSLPIQDKRIRLILFLCVICLDARSSIQILFGASGYGVGMAFDGLSPFLDLRD